MYFGGHVQSTNHELPTSMHSYTTVKIYFLQYHVNAQNFSYTFRSTLIYRSQNARAAYSSIELYSDFLKNSQYCN